METFRVLVTDPFEKEGTEILKKAGFQVDEVGKLAPEKVAELIGPYDVVIVRSGTRVTADAIRRADRLKIIGRAGVGLDNIDVAEATACGVIVMNAPEGNTLSAAEHTVGLLFSLARHIPQASASLKSGQWEKKKFMGTELYGKTLGVIGLGRIGQRVATMARCLGMKVLAFDPYVERESVVAGEISLVSLEGLCRQADFITLHLPLTDETRYLLGEKQFEMMKPEVCIVNCARGGILDEQALYAAVVSRRIRGAALDVFEKEPPEGNPLLAREEVIVTPHLGASTKEAQIGVAIGLSTQIVDALTRKIIRNAVNLPTLDAKAMEYLAGYHCLGEKLGILLSQMVEGNVREVNIEYAGEITSFDLALLRNNILKGLFGSAGNVNLVNVPLVAKERGISVKEQRRESSGEFSTLVSVSARGRSRVSASGTLDQKGRQRIVMLDGFSVEAAPEGYLLICYNDDVPGVLGHVGTILGRKNINIASMALGRKRKGGVAIHVVNVDEPIDTKTMQQIGEFPAIRSVKLVRL